MIQRILILSACLVLASCSTWNAGRLDPKGEPNRFGFTPKVKTTESVAIAEETNRALSLLPAAAFQMPTCNPELTENAEMLCVLGNSIAMSIAFATGQPVTAAGRIAEAGQQSIAAIVQGLTTRSANRWRAATFGLSGYFIKETQKAIGDTNAAIAQTVSQNGGIRIGSIQQSSSRHNSAAGEGGAGGEGAGGSGAGGGIDGQSLNQLVIGNKNSAGLGTDTARIAGSTGGSLSTIAEPSATVNQNTARQVGNQISDEAQGDFNQSDNDSAKAF